MRLYRKYFSVFLKGAMQYKVSFFLTMLAQFFVSFEVFLGVYFMFQRFHSVEGFTYSQVLNEVLPKMSPLNPRYLTKKQTVYHKMAAFVDKFKGVGGTI